MKKNSLTANKGLSLSQAQSISNLCNQRASEISAVLNGINNYEKTVDVDTKKDTKTHTLIVGKPIPENVVDLITEKSELHACQAFLMENIKAKDNMLKEAKSATVDISEIEVPEKPKFISPLVKMSSEVKEEWGWEQLNVSEINEYVEAEAFAAHIGQFIHEGKPLDVLRKELGKGINPVEWMTIVDGVKSPVLVKTHHTTEQLLGIHENLAKIHREKEQRVNYFKAKVKNLVTIKNAEIAKNNADAQNEAEKINNDAQVTFDTAMKAVSEKIMSIQYEFEKIRQENIKNIAAMRIEIDGRFQKTIDLFLSKLSSVEE